jgi:SAM-dependent methyltransferase
VGTDFAATALARVSQQVKAHGWRHVELWRRPADDFRDLESDSFDVVVLNSVVQYFPGIDYLMRLLEGAVSVLRPGGFIFVGDVRHPGLQSLLQSGIEAVRASASTSAAELRAAIARRIRQDGELVDPEFFAARPGRLPDITSAAFELKRGHHHNELTRFRYDAWLQSNGPVRDPAQPAADWSWQDVGEFDELSRRLADERPGLLRVRDIPNAWLLEEAALARWLERAKPDETLSDRSPVDLSGGVEPEFCWELVHVHGYRIYLTWSQRPENFDLCCAREIISNTPAWGAICEPRTEARPWNTIATGLRLPLWNGSGSITSVSFFAADCRSTWCPRPLYVWTRCPVCRRESQPSRFAATRSANVAIGRDVCSAGNRPAT